MTPASVNPVSTARAQSPLIPRSFGALIAMLILICAITLSSASHLSAAVCPFCNALSLTMTEQIRAEDIAVFARLKRMPEPVEDPGTDQLPKAMFEVVSVIKGKDWVEPGMEFRALIVGAYDIGQNFMVLGSNPPTVKWSMPMKSTPRVIEYVSTLGSLPDVGADRLAFFQQYFEDEESVLAFDAYDEFASASYEDMIALKDRMDREQLVEWIRDRETLINRRRLYLIMLGICGSEADIPMLETFICSEDRLDRAGFDALSTCYLTLAGEPGVDLLEERFLINKDADYGDTSAVISALQFINDDTDLIPKERIVVAFRHLLDRPKIADSVIRDLGRMEDWTVMEKLVQMFKDADDNSNWLRTPVINYLRACPRPEAAGYIEELRKIDPDAVRRADFFQEYGAAEFSEFGGDEIEELDDIEDVDDIEESNDAEPQSLPAAGGEGSADNETPSETFTALIQKTAVAGDTSHVVRKVPVTPTPGPEIDEARNGQANPIDAVSVRETATSLAAGSTNPSSSTRSSSSPIAPTTVAENGPVVAPIAAVTPANLLAKVILLPMVISILLFLLLWSVLSGWFERLIF